MLRYWLRTLVASGAFLVSGPTSWNLLMYRLRDPTLSSDSFRGKLLKQNYFWVTEHSQHSRADASCFCWSWHYLNC